MSWNESATNCCMWDGVTCDELTGHVIGLDLSCGQLYGTFDPNSSLFRLSHLQRLNLASNHFNFSRIPNAFGSFANLTHLNLSYSNFSGPIPSKISLLSKLISLDLSSSRDDFIFEPHHFRMLLKNLTQVQELVLHGVHISSALADSLTNLSSLTNLDLGGTELQGNIPNNIFHLPKLQRLVLSSNEDLRGNLPKLHGPIPHSVSKLSNLSDLILSSNNLSGVAELKMFSNVKFLKSLGLSDTNLSVNIKSNINSTLPKITSFFMNLKYLDLSNNKIHGTVPEWVTGKASLRYLNLAKNFLTSIEIPSSICNAKFLEVLDLSHNNFSNAIPPCLGNFSKFLETLNLKSNAFHGAIPLTFGKSSRMRNLNLNGNQFEGPVPPSLSNCKDLTLLDLGNNKINDTFPYWLGTLPKLQVLVLRSNRFHGPIHSSKGKFPFPKLRIVDLSHNNFIGHLPRRYFKNFKAMKNKTMPNENYMGMKYYQFSVTVTTKDQRMDFLLRTDIVSTLTVFTIIDLSSNKFRGEIPDEIGALIALHGLNLSHNTLTGRIPSHLGDLENLESLDLSSNQLVGTIPNQLTSLTFLEVLNLSRNHLNGPIPKGKQFNTFENRSYAGNSGLCGFPLSKECGDNQAQVFPRLANQQEDDSDFASGFTWKVVVMGYGCGMALGLFMGYLMFLTGRPKFFVRIVESEVCETAKRLKRTRYRRVGRRN